MNLKSCCSKGAITLILGVLLGNAEWILCLVYLMTSEFASPATKTACMIFVLAQPVFYWFMYTLYIINHPDCRDHAERFKKLALGPLYAILQQTKLLSAVDPIYRKFEEWFEMREPFHLLTVENCFKVQTFLELFLSTFP